MGNVPISCCRSKSPRLNRTSPDRSSNGNYHKCADGQYSTNNHDLSHGAKASRQGDDHHNISGSYQSQHILQHISEREPDDSETDPSSNPLNRPIFAARSSSTRNKSSNNYIDSCSSSNSRRQTHTSLMSSQDHGYNSNTSTNLTHYDGQLTNDSFDSSIHHNHHQQRVTQNSDELISTGHRILDDNKLLLNSPVNSGDNFSEKVNRIDYSHNYRDSQSKSPHNLQKVSSCSTIFINGSTISQPNLEQTIRCVSLAIFYHIKSRTSDKAAEIFDESIHPLKMPNQPVDNRQDELLILDREEDLRSRLSEPSQRTIYEFVETMFKAAQLTSEYAITSLVYLERLMSYAEMDLTPRTWRRMFLGAILLSSKVWEDQAVWNVDYAQILEDISVDDINELERQFLELIEFNMNVPSSVYAKYYFHLRTLALKTGISAEQVLLTVGEAKTLEAMSRAQMTDWLSSPIQRKSSPVIKRHTSLERMRLNGHTKAVLM